MLSYLKRLWRKLIYWSKPDYTLEEVIDAPDAVRADMVYLIGSHRTKWSAVFACPCGCGDAVWLNLLAAEDRPSWRVTKHRLGSFSIDPSIWRQVGCRSHFYVHRGRVLWTAP